MLSKQLMLLFLILVNCKPKVTNSHKSSALFYEANSKPDTAKIFIDQKTNRIKLKLITDKKLFLCGFINYEFELIASIDGKYLPMIQNDSINSLDNIPDLEEITNNKDIYNLLNSLKNVRCKKVDENQSSNSSSTKLVFLSVEIEDPKILEKICFAWQKLTFFKNRIMCYKTEPFTNKSEKLILKAYSMPSEGLSEFKRGCSPVGIARYGKGPSHQNEFSKSRFQEPQKTRWTRDDEKYYVEFSSSEGESEHIIVRHKRGATNRSLKNPIPSSIPTRAADSFCISVLHESMKYLEEL